MAGKSKRCIKSMCCICIFHCEHTFLCESRHLSRSHSYILSISSIPLPLALYRSLSRPLSPYIASLALCDRNYIPWHFFSICFGLQFSASKRVAFYENDFKLSFEIERNGTVLIPLNLCIKYISIESNSFGTQKTSPFHEHDRMEKSNNICILCY